MESRTVTFLILIVTLLIAAPLAAEPGGTSYIIVHAHNPEGVEIASIKECPNIGVQIYDGNNYIATGAYDCATHNQPIPISNGSHTIKVNFNGTTLEQVITLTEGETQTLTFTFARQEYDFASLINSLNININKEWVTDFICPADVFEQDFYTENFMDISGIRVGIRYSGDIEVSGYMHWNDANQSCEDPTTYLANSAKIKSSVEYAVTATHTYGRFKNTYYPPAIPGGICSWAGNIRIFTGDSFISGTYIESTYSNTGAVNFQLPITNSNYWFVQSQYLGGFGSRADILIDNDSILYGRIISTSSSVHSIEVMSGSFDYIYPQSQGYYTFADVNTVYKISTVPYDLYGTGVSNGESPQPPIASFLYLPETSVVGEYIIFDASESYDHDGKILDYQWDFGDGYSAFGRQSVSHSYAQPGQYIVTLTVTDNECLTNSISQTVQVSDIAAVISFLDSADLSCQVTGAVTDGESKVVIQVSGLPEDATINDVQISLPEGNQDGYLKDDQLITNGVLTQTYIVPDQFIRNDHPEDNYNNERSISLIITVYGVEIEHDPFILMRPPVVMLHGIWGHPWDFTGLQFKMVQEGWNAQFSVPVRYDNVLSYNNPKVQQTLKDYISNIQRRVTDAHIAKSKVDIVAHSMGGLVAKKLDPYFARKNVRKIITIGTPYKGSPVADLAWSWNNPLGRLVFNFFESMCNKLSYNEHSFTAGGLESLRTTNANVSTQIPGVDCGNIVVGLKDGSLRHDFEDLFKLSAFIFQLRLLKDMPPCTSVFGSCFSEQDVHDSIFGVGKNSDWLVSYESQKGDAPADGIVQKNVLWHAVEPQDIDIQEIVIQLLNQPTKTHQNSEISTNAKNHEIGLQAQTLTLPLKKIPFRQTAILESNEPNGTATILSPITGQICEAGGQIPISVQGSGATTAAAIFAFFGTSSWSDIVQLPWEGDVNVPSNSVGSKAQISVMGLDSNMNMTSEAHVNLVLDSDIVLEDISFGFGDNWYFDFIHNPQQMHQFQLGPQGRFSDGSVYPLSVLFEHTNYESSNITVATVDANGVVTANAIGSAIITITNSSKTTALHIEVEAYQGDINLDGIVNFKDFALFANQWMQTPCEEPNWCDGTDLDQSGEIDFADLMIIAQNWLNGGLMTDLILGDLNSDGIIDFRDFAILVDQWLQPPGIPSADIAPSPNGDGIVNFYDFAAMAGKWLEGE